MRKFTLPMEQELELHCCLWEPAGEPQGVVQIVHGVAEYAARYATLAEYLAAHGYVVTGEDHPGHGGTAKPEGLGSLDGGWMHTVKGVHRLYETVHGQYPRLPYFMLGHSMGSFLLRTYLFTYHTPLAGALLSGTGWQPAAILPLGLLVCKEEARRLGDHAASPLLERMMFGGYNQKFTPNRTTHDWLSTDEAVVDAYIADPLCGFPVSVQLCAEMLKGLRMIQSTENLARMRIDLPVRFYSGDQDPVGNMSKGVLQCVRAFEKAGMQKVSWKLYPGMRHEPHNEVGKEQVFADLLQWLQENM